MPLNFSSQEIVSRSKKFTVHDNNKEVGRAYLYILHNDLHQRPFGFIEDVFVEEEYRGQGVGSRLVENMMEEAGKRNCYKIIMTVVTPSPGFMLCMRNWVLRITVRNFG